MSSCAEILDAILAIFARHHLCSNLWLTFISRSNGRAKPSLPTVIKVCNYLECGIMWMATPPSSTIVHVFNYPFEACFGTVCAVCKQKYLRHSSVFTGTSLTDIVLSYVPPRVVQIVGLMCLVWYKGQAVICICTRICGKEGHKLKSCPDDATAIGKGSWPGIVHALLVLALVPMWG